MTALMSEALLSVSALLITRITGRSFLLRLFISSAIRSSPAPIYVTGSTIQTITSASAKALSATVSMYSPSLFFALCMPGVSINMICPRSSVYTVSILFLVVWGLSEVMAIFWPISLFMSVDFPTLGRPTSAAYPDFKITPLLI